MQIQNVETGEAFEDSADILMTGTGLLNEWKWPNIPGLHKFQGSLLHSARWDENFDSKVGQLHRPPDLHFLSFALHSGF